MFYFLRASLAIQSVLSTCLQPSAKYSKQVTPLPPEKKMNPHTYIHQTFTYSPIHTRIKLFAFVNSPKVVCLEDSLPTGTMSFNFSKQYLKCARLLDRKKKILKSQTRTQNCYLIMPEVTMQKI